VRGLVSVSTNSTVPVFENGHFRELELAAEQGRHCLAVGLEGASISLGRFYLRFLSSIRAISRWCCSAGNVFLSPVLQFRIISTLRVTLEQIDRILMRSNLHWIVLAREIVRLRIAHLVELLLRRVINRARYG